jgi:undecaprenyl diphosphate synthase
MGLLRLYLRREVDDLDRNGVRLRLIGDYRRFSPDIVEDLDRACARLAGNRGLTLVIALNYGGQDELARVARTFAEAARAGTLNPAEIDCDLIEESLDTAGLPPLDLLIRTSGETRLSNFLLWQAAYAELRFTDTLWPDFNGDTLADAVTAFGQRQRRYGGL